MVSFRLTHSQNRKLQRLRAKEKKAQEAERIFNETHPMQPPRQWVPTAVKILEQTAKGLTVPTPDCPAHVTGLSGAPDCPVAPDGLFGKEQKEEVLLFGDSEAVPMATEESAAANGATSEEALEEEMVDYETSPEHTGMDINVIIFSADYDYIGEDEEDMAQFNFGPKEAKFVKPTESVNHLKPLYVRGHIDGVPISRMLVDGGAVVNLMSY